MADKKISDLTAVTSLATGDLFELENAGGNSRKVTAGNLKAYTTGWSLISTNSPSGVSAVDFTGLSGYHELLVVARALTSSVSGLRQLQASVDNGSTFFSAAGDYKGIATTGVENNNGAWAFHATSTTAARTLVVHIINTKGTVKVCHYYDSTSNFSVFTASASDIDALRISNSGGGTISGGPIYLFGR